MDSIRFIVSDAGMKVLLKYKQYQNLASITMQTLLANNTNSIGEVSGLAELCTTIYNTTCRCNETQHSIEASQKGKPRR